VLRLESERLILRNWSDDDVDFVYDMYSRWEVQRYLGTSPKVMVERSEAVARVKQLRALDHPVHGVWAIERNDGGGLVGSGLLKPIPASGTGGEPSGDVEIGWHLHPGSWGHGYASEAAARLLRHAFESGLPQVVAVTYPENIASQRVAERIGMIHRGRTERYYDTTCELFIATRPPSEVPA